MKERVAVYFKPDQKVEAEAYEARLRGEGKEPVLVTLWDVEAWNRFNLRRVHGYRVAFWAEPNPFRPSL